MPIPMQRYCLLWPCGQTGHTAGPVEPVSSAGGGVNEGGKCGEWYQSRCEGNTRLKGEESLLKMLLLNICVEVIYMTG